MKRSISPALMVLLVLFLLPKERGCAREESEINLSSLKWQLLSPGVSKTDMGGDLPEVAILKLTNEQFEKIHASEDAAKDYLNGQSIFKWKLLKVVFCVVTPHVNGGPWFLIIPHTKESTASITAWQVPRTSKED
jgi:hypothetical protein